MLFVARRRLEPARWSAAVAVGAIVAGWALAQQPQLLPGLTVEQAAAGDATLVALLVSLALGAMILIPSLVLLFGLMLRGRFDERPGELGSLERAGERTARRAAGPEPGRAAGIAAAVCATLGVPLMFLSDAGVGARPRRRTAHARARSRGGLPRAAGGARRLRRRLTYQASWSSTSTLPRVALE